MNAKRLLSGIYCLTCLSALSSYGQDCKNFLFFQKDKTVEITIYNKKGEANGKQVYKISDVSTSGGVTTAKLASEMFNEKGKSLAKANSSVSCNGGVMMMDMKMMMMQMQGEQFKTEAKADNVYLEYPATMNAGDQLKDGNFTMQMNTAGIGSTTTMVISDRKVEGKESVTTPAGTWDCYKIGYKCKMTIKMGPIPINRNFDGEEWFAPGFGIVKTQSKYGGTAITSIQ